jgi:hypothetical protein
MLLGQATPLTQCAAAVDSQSVTRQRKHEPVLRPAGTPDDGTVSAGARKFLADVDRAAGSERRTAALRDELEAELSEDRATMAEISGDLARVHAQLDQINAGIIGLQSHNLRQTGVAALALAVLVAIAWKVVGG